MSLNAVVYCDCVEKERVTIRHPRPDLLYIDERGCPDISSDDSQAVESHDRWESLRPCPHEHFWLIQRWLGNVSSIGLIREFLQESSSQPAEQFPVLWSKVIYSGSHTGDFLNNDDVLRLGDEVDRLSKVHGPFDAAPVFLESFLCKLRELVSASASVNKPISF